MPADADFYLVWSSEYAGWRRPYGWGGPPHIDDAACLDRAEAIRICRNAKAKATHIGRPAKIPVR